MEDVGYSEGCTVSSIARGVHDPSNDSVHSTFMSYNNMQWASSWTDPVKYKKITL